jgi:hypothetical protein
VQGWITLNNTTGTTFPGARVLLVAGKSGAVTGTLTFPVSCDMADATDERPGMEAKGTARRLAVYPIAGRTTPLIISRSRFLSSMASRVWSTGIEMAGFIARTGAKRADRSEILEQRERRSGRCAACRNRARLCATKRGQPQFIGEQGIGHTPMGSSGIATGEAFDVKVQSAVVKRERIDLGEWERVARWRVTVAEAPVREGILERDVVHWQTGMEYTVTNAAPACHGGTGPIGVGRRLERHSRAQ